MLISEIILSYHGCSWPNLFIFTKHILLNISQSVNSQIYLIIFIYTRIYEYRYSVPTSHTYYLFWLSHNTTQDTYVRLRHQWVGPHVQWSEPSKAIFLWPCRGGTKTPCVMAVKNVKIISSIMNSYQTYGISVNLH